MRWRCYATFRLPHVQILAQRYGQKAIQRNAQLGRVPGLLAFPAQSNFSGVHHPLALVAEAQARGFDVLLDAAAKMSGNGHIAIVGSGPAGAELRAQAEQLHLDDRIAHRRGA